MRSIVVVFLTLTVLGGTAAAQPAQTRPQFAQVTRAVTTEHAYGLQILAVDALGLAAFAVAGAADSEGLAYGGMLTLVAGPAIVHASHGRTGAAVGSVALRAGLPILGAALGAASENCGDDELLCGLGGTILGGMVGYGVAVTIDAAILARETRVVRQSWQPTLTASSRGAQVGVVGTF